MKIIFACIFFVSVVSIQALTEDEKNTLRNNYDKCTTSTGVDKTLIDKARKGEFSSDSKLQEYYFCMFQAIGIVNDNGDIQIDVIKSKVPSDIKPEDAEKVITTCKDQKGSTKFQTAQKLYECYYTNSPTHITFA